MSGIAPAHEVVVVRQDDAEVLGGPPVTGRLYADSSATGVPARRAQPGCSGPTATNVTVASARMRPAELTASTGVQQEIMDPAISKPHEALARWQAAKAQHGHDDQGART